MNIRSLRTKSAGWLAIVLLACSPLAAAPSEQQAWDDYMKWANSQPRLPRQEEWKLYREKLVSDGLTPDAASQQIALLERLIPSHRAELGRMWMNRLYRTTDQTRFSTEPNLFLVDTVKALKPGKALDVAMGQGRNAVFLATQGWDVTGIDIADDGLRSAQANAAAAGTKLTTLNVRFEDFDYGESQWDLICFIYTDAPVLDPLYVARITKALKPGGLLLIERPHRLLDGEDPDLGPLQPNDLPNALPRAWDGLRILRYEDLLGISDWQQTRVDRHERPLRIIRLLAEKR